MRFKSLALSTASLGAMLLGASPVLAAQAAQPATPATPNDPNVVAQTNPADPNDGAPQTDDAVQTAAEEPGEEETIVVTGLRRSLQSAQNIKRNSDQIVDAIVAEDIGKLPDVTASAALARVTGVQVNRAAAEAADVQVRGLPDISTTYNGREIFTGTDRNVAIQDFPAGSVAALEVFKSSTANLVEGGLGGQVNVRSRKPFDFKGLEISGSLNAVRFTQIDETDYNGNLLISNRWKVGDGEFGLLVNGALTNIQFLDSTREQAFVMRDLGGGLEIPDAAAVFFGSGKRVRPSGNFALEYRPNSDLRFYVDGLWQGFRGRDSNLFLFVPLFGPTAITDVRVGADGQIDSAVGTGGFNPDGYQEFVKLNTNTFQFGSGFSYDLGSVVWTGDIAGTDSKVTRRQANVDFAFASSPTRVVNFDSDRGVGGPTLAFPGFDTASAANYLYRGLFQVRQENEGSDVQLRTDIAWDTGFTNLPRLQVGLRHNSRDADFRRGSDYRPAPDPRPLLSSIPAPTGPLECGFDYDNSQGVKCLFGTSYNGVFDNLAKLRTFAGFPAGDISFDPLSAYHAEEKASAAYAQVGYEFDLGFPIDGQIGLRAVRTKTVVEGTLRTFPGDVQTPISRSNTYTDYLPNISARFGFRRNLQGRLAYTETRTRPSFGDLNPGATLDQPQGVCADVGPTSPACFRTGSGGNPDLSPIASRNYDATLEYYFGRQGSLTVSAFQRDIRGFIFRDNVDTPEGTTVNFIRFNSPQNGGNGKIKGVELAGTTFFDYDFLPDLAQGFGVQANYTYIDASTQLGPQFRNGQLGGQQRFPFVSKHAYNLIGLYERGPISARLAYNWRSRFVTTYEDIQGFQSPVVQKSLGQLDFSTSYTPFENVTIAFDALNLLAGSEPIRLERTYNAAGETFDRSVKYLERVFSLGVRFRI